MGRKPNKAGRQGRSNKEHWETTMSPKWPLTIRPDVPIIMCTGYSYVVDAEAAKAAGIRAFAMKPLTKREIARTVRKVIDK